MQPANSNGLQTGHRKQEQLPCFHNLLRSLSTLVRILLVNILNKATNIWDGLCETLACRLVNSLSLGRTKRKTFRDCYRNPLLRSTLWHPRNLRRFFPTCQVRVVRFYVSCFLLVLVLLLLLPLLVLLLVSSSSPLLAIHSVLCRTSTTTLDAQCSLSDLNHDHPRPVFPAGPQPRPSPPSVPCRTSTTTIHAQCSLPELNHDHPRPVFPAGPQPRPSTPSVPCRTSTASIHAKRYAT